MIHNLTACHLKGMLFLWIEERVLYLWSNVLRDFLVGKTRFIMSKQNRHYKTYFSTYYRPVGGSYA